MSSTPSLRILHLEDDPSDTELVQGTLAAEGVVCDLTRVETQSEFTRCLEQGGYDLILADYTLPSFDGMSALKIVKEVSPEVPFIFVSGTLDEEVAIEALKLGATDYVFKTRLSRIVPSVHRALREAKERSQRRLAEETLRQSETYLAEAQRLSQTGSWAWNPATGENTYGSEECLRLLGFDPAGPLPRFEEFFQRIHPADQAASRERFEKAIRDKADFEFGYRIVHPENGVRDIHVVGHAVLDRSGELHEFVGTAIDITERKRAEQTLRQSEAYLAEAQRLSQTGSWAWTPATGDIRYWSEECYRVLGFDPLGPLPRFETFFQRIHPDDQVGMKEQFEKAIRERANFELYYRVVHPGKGIRDIHAVGHAVLDRSGDLVEFVGTVIDITERKRAEKELQQLVDFVPQVIVVMDPNGKWIHANRVAREYTGLTLDDSRLEDVVGIVVHPDDVEKVRTVRERGFSATDPFEIEARLRGKDGVYRWFLLRYNPLLEEGCVRRWYASATEIELRKRGEEQVRKENVRLEERTRIAQELHDTLLQSFVSASMQLGVALDGVPQDSPVKARLDRILQLMTHGIEEGRNTIQGLRSSDSHTLDLVLALSGVQQELAVRPEIDFRVIVAGRQQPLRAPIRHEIYRIGREALVNAFCHSQAKRVEFELEYADNDLRMRVRDNGRGIDPAVLHAGREGHWGLAGMQERATRIGGLLKISSSASDGTEVQLSIPSAIAFQLSPADRIA
jgi:PAS domain S-box-containing protein